VSLNLYLDDCSNSDLLADLLRQAGHRVVRYSIVKDYPATPAAKTAARRIKALEKP
jgi:molybdopterin biosynthesis enzyme